LRPFQLAAGSVTVEVRRGSGGTQRRTQELQSGVREESDVQEILHALAAPLLEPPAGVRGLQVRLARLAEPSPQAPLFPGRVQRLG
jgi:hypothetical protein